MISYRYEYHGEDIGIKDYLCKLGFSSTFIKRVKYGGVKQNGVVIHMRAIVKDGDFIEITDEEKVSFIQPRSDISLTILYENDDLLAVHKPSGMPTHPSRGNHLPTLAEVVVGHFQGSPFTFRAVNRLDKDTSGIVLIAKNATAAYRLSNSMKQGLFQKEYEAIVKGIPTPQKGRIDAPIRRETDNSMKRCVADDGKTALTDYEVTEIDLDNNAKVHLVLHSGRTHQIRVHMAYIGHPLFFDELYGEKVSGKTFTLKAVKLAFPNPKSGETIVVEDPFT